MGGVPLATRAYTVVLSAATVAAFVATLAVEGWQWSSRDIGIAAILFVMILVVEHLDIHFIHAATFTLSVGAILALSSGLTLGPLNGTLLVIVATACTEIIDRRNPVQAIVNVTNIGISTLFATQTYQLLAEPGTPLSPIQNVGATFVAALVYAVANSWILAVVVAPIQSASAWEIWNKNRDGFIIELATLPPLAILIPVVANENPLGILLFIIPLAGPHVAVRTLRKVEQQTQEAMEGLADAVERRDPYTYRHSIRVTAYVQDVLSEVPHVPLSMSEAILAAARIHDLGKVGTRDIALKKPAALDPSERLEMQQHAVIGADIVSHLSMYEASAAIIRHHHEWWNGEGYPDGLREEAIPLGSRIIAVADAYDAMTSDRVYRKALSSSTAMAELRKQAGRQFDPEVVAAFERSQAQRMAVPERRLAAVGGD